MHGLNIEALLQNTASESIFVWMKNPSEGKDGKIDSFELEGENAVKSAMICYNAGASLYFRYELRSKFKFSNNSSRSPQEMAENFIPLMTQSLGMNFGGFYSNGEHKGEIETFLSRKGHGEFSRITFNLYIQFCSYHLAF